MVGPTLIVHGTEEQKKEHLPEDRQRRGALGPGLLRAGLRLGPRLAADARRPRRRRVRDQRPEDLDLRRAPRRLVPRAHADDPDAPKHRGISYFLVDDEARRASPCGRSSTCSATTSFNETFFEDVRVPAGNLVGEENRGWYVGATLLDFERSGVTGRPRGRRQVEQLVDVRPRRTGAERPRASTTRTLRNGLADLRDRGGGRPSAQLPGRLDAEPRNQVPNYEASMSKVFGSELGPAHRELRHAHDRPRLAAHRRKTTPARRIGGAFGRAYMRTVPGDDRGRHERDPAQHHRDPRPRVASRVGWA